MEAFDKGLFTGTIAGAVGACLMTGAFFMHVKIGLSPAERMCEMRASLAHDLWKSATETAAFWRRMERDQRARATDLALTWASLGQTEWRTRLAGMTARGVAEAESAAARYRGAAEDQEARAADVLGTVLRSCVPEWR